MISATVNISLNLICIPKYGYQVAAYTTYVGYSIMLVLHIYNMTRLGFKSFINVRMLLALFFAVSVLGLIFSKLYNYTVARYIILLLLLIAIILNLNKIKSFYYKLRGED